MEFFHKQLRAVEYLLLQTVQSEVADNHSTNPGKKENVVFTLLFCIRASAFPLPAVRVLITCEMPTLGDTDFDWKRYSSHYLASFWRL